MKIYSIFDGLGLILLILFLFWMTFISFQEKTIQEIKIEIKPKVTAILTFTNSSNIEMITRICNIKFINQVIILNQNIDKEIKNLQCTCKILIFNMKNFIKKRELCNIHSQNEICYFQDLEWENKYINSQYFKFIKNLNVSVIINDPILFYQGKYKNFGKFKRKNYISKQIISLILPIEHYKKGKYFKKKSKLLLKNSTYDKDKTSCFNDQCLFFTNVKDYKDLDFYLNNYYYYSVDNNPNTCWKSLNWIQKGNYFGLDLLKNNFYSYITLVFSKMNSNHKLWSQQLNIYISKDGKKWNQITKLNQFSFTSSKLIYQLSDRYYFRFIKFQSNINYLLPFELCEISVKMVYV